ncbi:MAG: GIY-YIG nuclease family protein [Verrucomicrobia bacterium]|nr:GIY-YIG nuclease family protein [Verrucomicrobiota bacterium]MDA1066911.1 GIY-YIG nuclease family protein [Verrucomicrobiota bacterium]
MPLDPQFYYVYILVSESDKDRHYSGFTTDLNARLKKHNNGEVSHTSKFRPWLIETAVRFRSKNKAHAFESYLKSGSGREFARRHF